MRYRLNTKKPPLLCLILLISFPSISTVLISPALPAISDFFSISNGYVQQLITIFLIGYAVGQLIYSPFANRFGRKIAVYLGISLYLISCVICLFGIYFHYFDLILLGRLLMALGSSVGMIISFTVINDFYYPEQARPIVSYTVLAYAFMPALAIALGGFVTTHFSWIYCFYIYLLYGMVILLISMLLPETLQHKNVHALKIKVLLRSYGDAFASWRLVLFSSIYGLMASFIYIIASGAPFIGIDKIGLSAAIYGVLLFIPYCAQFIGALCSAHLSKRLSAYRVIACGYSSVVLGSLFMFISFLLHWINVFSFILPICFIMLGLPMVYSSVTVMALREFEDKATGSAVMSFITMSVTLAITLVLTFLPNQNPLMMPLLFIVVLTFAITALWQARRRFSDE